MPPHFDVEGRRQTREGRSNRALTDDALLRIYLDRKADSFVARFRHIATELREAVGAVGAQVDQIGETIDRNIGQPLGIGQGLWRIKKRSFVMQQQLHPAELKLFDTSARASGQISGP